MVRWRRQMAPSFTSYTARFQDGNKVMSISYPGKGFFILSIDSSTFRCAALHSVLQPALPAPEVSLLSLCDPVLMLWSSGRA